MFIFSFFKCLTTSGMCVFEVSWGDHSVSVCVFTGNIAQSWRQMGVGLFPRALEANECHTV